MRAATPLAAGIAALVVFVAPLQAGSRAEGKDHQQPLKLSISNTLFLGMPESVVMAVMKPFGALMHNLTGLRGEMIDAGDGIDIAEKIMKGDLDFGVIEGVEFAWAKQKHPELRPLLLTVNQQNSWRAFLVVRKDSKLEGCEDLKGKRVVMPDQCRRHCRLFLDRKCAEVGRARPDEFFSRVLTTKNVEDALDDVVDGKADAAIIDNISLDCFKRRKPGRFAHLQIVEKSEEFPASVIVYRHGRFREATLRQFRQGMARASQDTLGRHLLTVWKLSGFVPVPEDFEDKALAIARTYPPPFEGETAEPPEGGGRSVKEDRE